MEKIREFAHLSGLALKILLLGAIFVPTFVILLVLEAGKDVRDPLRRTRRKR